MGVAPQASSTAETSFFPIMAIVIALVIVAGFGPSYAHRLAQSGLPLWVHLHGVTMIAWILLFTVQSWLAANRSLRLHRRLGLLSIGLVAAILPLGAATNILAVERGATPPSFTPAEMMAADLLDLLLFGGLFTGALVPALGRLVAISGVGLPMIIPVATVLLIALALAGPACDLVMRGRIHPAFLWGAGLLILSQPLHLLVAATAPVQAAARALAP